MLVSFLLICPQPVHVPYLTLPVVSCQTRDGEHLALLAPQTLTRAMAGIANLP